MATKRPSTGVSHYRPALEVLQPHRGDLALARVENVLDRRIPDELDLGILEGSAPA
jgi:hypothetical protein